MSFNRNSIKDLISTKKSITNENKESKVYLNEMISKDSSIYTNSNEKYFTPLYKKYSDMSHLSTAKMTNLTSTLNSNYSPLSSFTNKSISNLLLNTTKKPSLNSKESRNKLKALKSNQRKGKTLEEIIDYQQNHLLVPIKKQNDEIFKLFTMKNIKKKSFPEYKSAKKCEDSNIESRKELDSAIEYSIVKKKQVTHSTKKNLYIIHRLYDNDDNEYKFPLFKDFDIGINEYWQSHLVESYEDEDNDTDDELLDQADSYTLSELEEALIEIKEKGLTIVDRLNKSAK